MWKPTNGFFPSLDSQLNVGTVNGKTLYLHYTNEEAGRIIGGSLVINDKRRNETRAGSASGIYLCPSTYTFSPENVVDLLFLGEKQYQDRGKWLVAFGFTPTETLTDERVTQGSWVRELIYMGAEISFDVKDLVYSERNPFPNLFDQSGHPLKGVYF